MGSQMHCCSIIVRSVGEPRNTRQGFMIDDVTYSTSQLFWVQPLISTVNANQKLKEFSWPLAQDLPGNSGPSMMQIQPSFPGILE